MRCSKSRLVRGVRTWKDDGGTGKPFLEMGGKGSLFKRGFPPNVRTQFDPPIGSPLGTAPWGKPETFLPDLLPGLVSGVDGMPTDKAGSSLAKT